MIYSFKWISPEDPRLLFTNLIFSRRTASSIQSWDVHTSDEVEDAAIVQALIDTGHVLGTVTTKPIPVEE